MLLHRTCVASVLALAASSCFSVPPEPWSHLGAGTHAVSAKIGAADFDANVNLRTTEALGTDLNDELDFAFSVLAGVGYRYHLTDRLALGGSIDARTFDSGVFLVDDALDISAQGDDLDTVRLAVDGRYYFEPLGGGRWRPFVGLELGYVPETDIDFRVEIPGGFESRIQFEGDSSWSLDGAVGLSYLMGARTALELGAMYEVSLASSEGQAVVTTPGLPTVSANAEIEPEGIIGFIGLTVFL